MLLKCLIRLFALFIVVTLTFCLMKALPGDPFMDERALPKEIHERLVDHYGLNDPTLIQYGRYLRKIVTGNMGPSFIDKERSVNQIIAEGFPVSLQLGLEALCFAALVGVTGGIFTAFRGSLAGSLAATAVLSVPTFLAAALLQYYVGYKWKLLPIARWNGFAGTILPSIALGAMPAAMIFKYTKERVAETLHQQHVQFAYAKGLSSRRVALVHVLPNALIPLLPYFGPLAANIIVGSFVTEKIFSIPGLGRWFVMSVLNRDYTAIMGLTVFYSVLLFGLVILCDILYYLLDPRQREQEL